MASSANLISGKSAAGRYALAILAGIGALLLRELLVPVLGIANPYHTAWAAVVLAAWYCGLGPAIVTTLITALGVWYWFVLPLGSFAVEDPKSQIPGLVGFVFFSGVIMAIVEASRRSEKRSQLEIAERSRREHDLQETERELHLAQRLATIGSWKWYPQSDTVVWSEGLYRLTGRDSNLPAPTFAENRSLFSPESWQRLETAVEKTLQTGEGYDLELELIRSDGTVLSTMTHAEAERDSSGTVVTVFGSIQDVTASKRVEQTLRESEERLRLAQKASHSGTWEWNFETQELISSPELDELYGLPSGSGPRRDWRERIHPDDLPNFDKTLQQSATTGEQYRHEFRINRTDGAVRWMEANGRIFYNEGGKPVRIIGVSTDITERKQKEEALQRSEYRLKTLIDSNIIPIVCSNMEQITEANDAYLDLVGYSREDLAAGRVDWIKMTPSEHLPKDLAGLNQLKNQGFFTPFEKEYIRKDGVRVPILIGATVLSPAPLEWMAFVLDLSNVRLAESELRKSHEELEHRVGERTRALGASLAALESEVALRTKTEQFLRQLSARSLFLQDEERRRIARDLHDSTGQTLVALKLMIAALAKMVTAIPSAPELLAEIELLAEQALQEIRVTSHLLHPPLLDEVGFSSAAQWYVEGFEKRSGIKTTIEIKAAPRLTKDEELVFFRVLQESLTNVVRHSGSETVDIQVSSDEENAILSIRDYGKGLPAEKLASFQETGAGVGVGLGGMKQRVRALGGHLRLDCSGTGTRVIATLPIAPSVHAVPKPTETSAA